MVLFWLMWLCLALWGAARLLGAEGWVGLWLQLAPATTYRVVSRHTGRLGGRWPPAVRVAPGAGPPARLTS
jgi:hypothetical protein